MIDDIQANRPVGFRKRQVVLFSAYIGALSVMFYQAAMMVAWGGQDLYSPLLEILWSFSLIAFAGAIFGVIAAAIYLVGRWFLRLDK